MCLFVCMSVFLVFLLVCESCCDFFCRSVFLTLFYKHFVLVFNLNVRQIYIICDCGYINEVEYILFNLRGTSRPTLYLKSVRKITKKGHIDLSQNTILNYLNIISTNIAIVKPNPGTFKTYFLLIVYSNSLIY